MDRILEIAKAVVAAVVAAVIGALAGIDWYEVIAGSVASGGLTYRIPNKKKRR